MMSGQKLLLHIPYDERELYAVPPFQEAQFSARAKGRGQDGMGLGTMGHES